MRRIILFASVLTLFFTQCSNEEQSTKQAEKGDEIKTSVTQKKDVKFKASSEKIADVGEIFQVTFELNQESENFTPPDFENFDVISGPMTSSFSSLQIINGKSSRSITNSYTFNISASNPGIFTIKPAEAVVEGNTYKSNSLQIKIIGENTLPKNHLNDKKQKITSKADIFLRTEFSKTSVFNGEFITATTKIYTKTDFQNISQVKFPDYSGFWSKTLQEPRQIKFHNELINGKKYSTALLRQILLFAVKPGKYTIEPYEITLQLKKKDGKARDFFGNIVDNYKLINKRLKTATQNIVVKPLPEPVPQNFSGFTGKKVSVKAEIDTHIFKTDESAELKIAVSGTGNLYLLNDLKINLPDGLKHFKPETELNDKYTEFGEIGDRIFKFIITADKTGKYSIPPIDFVYFDSETKNYKTLSTNPINIQVIKGKAYNPNSDSEKIVFNKDIRYIKDKNINLQKVGSRFIGSVYFYLLYVILIVIFILIIYLRKKYLKANADFIAVRKKKAGKVSQKRLKKAFIYIKENNNKAFYKEIMSAIWGYLGDKLSVSSDDLTKDKIQNLLSDKNINKELINKLINVLEISGYAQYSPSDEDAKPEKIYKETEEVINELENLL